ncbi:MAG: DUF1730 domain-containing protein [Deltaproteobacteria bacterium]|nr:DUF1730 domain-containing protein [Deltaproteobacteria bacterium]
MKISLKNLSAIAGRHGFVVCSALPLEVASQVLQTQSSNLRDWQDRNYCGEMKYMERRVDIFIDLRNFLPEVRFVVVLAIPYSGQKALHFLPKWGYGRVSRYAWGKDYHIVCRSLLESFIADLEVEIGDVRGMIKWRAFSDAVPLLERALGARSGLGFVGKNAMLIRPGLGSYFFIAEILWDVSVSDWEENPNLWRGGRRLEPKVEKSCLAGENCSKCTGCIEACPTEAIVSPGVIDARRCISYLTIEKKTPFSPQESSSIGDWIFGCDMCQEVCPFNAKSDELQRCDSFLDSKPCKYLSLQSILGISSDGEFKQTFKDTPFMRARRERLVRNACSVASNTKYFPAAKLLSILMQQDSSELIRAQARYSLEELARCADGVEAIRIGRFL